MSADMRDLEWHGNQLRARLKVPTRLVPLIGRKKLVQGLGTDSKARAQMLKRPHMARFHQMVAEAERQLAAQLGSASSPLALEAAEFRAELDAALNGPKRDALLDADRNVDVDGVMLVRSLIAERAEELSRSGDRRAAALFYGLASGTATPLPHYLETYLGEQRNMKPRQKSSYRTAIRSFDRWLTAEREPPIVEAITTKTTGRYVSALLAQDRHWKTLNKDVSACSSYWRWLVKKGLAPANPWQGQSVPKQTKSEDEDKRPFNDDEVLTLLGGGADQLLMDFMIVSALSALRVGEIAALEVRDVAGGLFNIRESKTPSGVRKAPIHPHLSSILDRRRVDKTDRDSLFDDLRIPKEGSTVERYQPITKRFTRYRRKLGVDERVEGARQSLIDFHSFRRWFARKAFDAIDAQTFGFSYETVAEVMGHKSGNKLLGMTIHYAGRGPMEARRRCVEAVRLPQRTGEESEPNGSDRPV